VVIPNDAYGGTFRLFARVLERWGLDFTPAWLGDLDQVRAAIRPQTRLIWCETPTNPLLGIADIAALAGLAREHDALLAVDNTFATPYLQRPLELGAAVVVHSTTKYIGGHSDVVGGALVITDPGLAEAVRFHQNSLGGVPGPFDPGWCCAEPRPSASGWTGTARTPSASSRCSRSTRAWAGCCIRGFPTVPVTRSRPSR